MGGQSTYPQPARLRLATVKRVSTAQVYMQHGSRSIPRISTQVAEMGTNRGVKEQFLANLGRSNGKFIGINF